jgi:S-(hydroxymethyl)glutathione dehydrogenase/alcohol dehydrogenase
VDEVSRAVLDSTGGPVDVAVECSGAPVAIESACRVLGINGTAALVGIPPAAFTARVAIGPLLQRRQRVVGSLNGAIVPNRDLVDIVEHVRAGRLDLDAQVSRMWPVREFEDAIAALRRGDVVRAVLSHPADG